VNDAANSARDGRLWLNRDGADLLNVLGCARSRTEIWFASIFRNETSCSALQIKLVLLLGVNCLTIR
jgi:hypothetical protein